MKPKELVDIPKLPDVVAHIWEYFAELNKTRSFSDAGPSSISWQEFRAWRLENKLRLDPWERDALFKLDDTFISVAREQADRARAQAEAGGRK